MKVFRKETYKSPTDFRYIFTVYTKNENESRVWLTDLVPESLLPPRKINGVYVPYWAYLSNEPSPGQRKNARVNLNTEENYTNRSRLKEGDYIVYILEARRDIKAGEEILWYYGDAYYVRDYLISENV
jgi:hypothetical protein